ncbi:hypothetical protein MTR67_020038, partial [Solanum verrucosum]
MTWEMEIVHKADPNELKTMDPNKFTISVNGRKGLTPVESAKLGGSYNIFLQTSLPENVRLYNPDDETFESSQNLFRSIFLRGFAIEILHVYSGPPGIVYKFRHWGYMDAPFKGHAPTGQLVELFGIGTFEYIQLSFVFKNAFPLFLVGGFYDAGNNIKFSFTIAYTVGGNNSNAENDLTCWQRLEDMNYPRLVSVCDISTASDLAGEMVAALPAASLVLKEDKDISAELFILANRTAKKGKYTMNDECGGHARQFYNSTSYKDELVWVDFAVKEQIASDEGVFDWNNKITAISPSTDAALLQYAATSSFLSKLYSNTYPFQVHHRAASIPWDGPNMDDIFSDKRSKPWFTEPSIASNAGLVAALVALHDPPTASSLGNLGIDKH